MLVESYDQRGKSEEIVNVFLVIGIFISFACLILTWVVFEPLVQDPSYEDWIQLSVIGVFLSGHIVPILGIMFYLIGAIINIRYPMGSGFQIAGLIVFGVSAPDLVSQESIPYLMTPGLGFVVAWFGTILVLISSFPFLKGIAIDQGRGTEPVGEHAEHLSQDLWRPFSVLGMRRRW